MQGSDTMLDLLHRSLLRLARPAGDEDGQALTEYALVLVLIALVTILALTVIGGTATSTLTTAARNL